MARVITGDQADTPITDIPIGIAASGGTATGAIGRACRDVGLPKSEPALASPCPPWSGGCRTKAEAPPQPERRSSTVIL